VAAQPQPQTPTEQEHEEPNNGDDHLGHIKTITEGFTGGGSSRSAQRKHLRSINSVSILPPRTFPPITFTDENFNIHDLD